MQRNDDTRTCFHLIHQYEFLAWTGFDLVMKWQSCINFWFMFSELFRRVNQFVLLFIVVSVKIKVQFPTER